MSRGSSAPVRDALPPIRAWLRSMSDRTRAQLEYHFEHDLQREFVIAASGDAADVVIVDHDFPGARAAMENGRWRDGPPLIVLAHGAVTLDDVLVLIKPVDRSSLDAVAVRLRGAAPGTRPAGLVGRAPTSVVAGTSSHAPSAPRTDPLPEASANAPSFTRTTAPASAPASASPPAPVAGGAETATADSSGTSTEPPLIELRRDRRPPVPPDRSSVASVPRDARARTRVAALCGPPRTLRELADRDDPRHRYDPARHLNGRLAAALDSLGAGDRDVRGLMLALPGIELYVLPWLDRICTSEPLTWNVGVDRAFGRLDDDDGEVVSYHAGTVNALVARVNANACQAYPITAFRWLAALFSARGRLPLCMEMDQSLRLAHWPNFSRLEMTPECMRIAAEWTVGPRSIADLVEHLDCEPRYVTALHAAATAVALLHPADPTTDPGEDDGA